MAISPSHRFGQIIGDLLEEILTPLLEDFCRERNLYLDKKGERGTARKGKKVTWQDKFGNRHDLDFVIEKGGSESIRGRPLAFIEAAWRRYTKHSRNKAQEIQGAILPIAEKYEWDKPFLGVILAGVFTENALTQMRSSGFDVVSFPYETIIAAFKSVNINAEFDENTPDAQFQQSVDKIESLSLLDRKVLKDHLVAANNVILDDFIERLENVLGRRVQAVILIPLHGAQNEFHCINDAIHFIEKYQQDKEGNGDFRKYEIIVRYTNGDTIDAAFSDKIPAVSFLKYIKDE
jgi:hypothetical protein